MAFDSGLKAAAQGWLQYLLTPPTLSDGNVAPLQGDASGNLKVSVQNSSANPVAVAGAAYPSVLSLTRTADTNAYTAGDVLGTGTGSAGASLAFPGIGPAAGGEVIITSAALEIDLASIPSGMTSFRLYLYSVTPPSALGDNAAWDIPSGDRASFLGYVDLGSPVDLGSTLYVQTAQINQQVTVPVGGELFGYLMTNGGYTPASGTVYKVTLHAAGF